MAYQHAFLQNAVAQNMQIQQQLMMQNQALSQLLQQTSISDNQTSMSPQQEEAGQAASKPTAVYFGMNEAQRRASETHLNLSQGHSQMDLKPRSKTAPNTPKHSNAMPPQAPQLPPGGPMDAYNRERTVRIGKWRWPPPKEDGDALAEGFFQFKMRKMKEREGVDEGLFARNESLETSGEIQGLDWNEFNDELQQQGMKRSQSKDSFTIMEDAIDSGERRGISKSPTGSAQGTVGKLKISSEMKEKLEAAMGGSRKSSVASRKSSRGELDISGMGGDEEPEKAVKKLNENRKMLLQQKLGGGGKLKKWENIDQDLHQEHDHTSRKSSHESQGGHIPAPPPPPIAPTFNKQLHVETNQRSSASPVSSFYSPGERVARGQMTPEKWSIVCKVCKVVLICQLSVVMTLTQVDPPPVYLTPDAPRPRWHQVRPRRTLSDTDCCN